MKRHLARCILSPMDLTTLYERSVEHYLSFYNEPWLVRPAIPILYFGDIKQFHKSKLKIVTVGLNPSFAEFNGNRFAISDANTCRPADLENELCNYFKVNPYERWFNRSFELLLQAFDASYYGNSYPNRVAPKWWLPRQNVAIHTDIGTPLATNPTWSNLNNSETVRLQAKGLPLWRDLIAMIEPHMILISVAKSHLSLLGPLKWRSFSPFEFSEFRHEMRIADFGKSKIVWGQSQVTPFFHLKREHLVSTACTVLREAGISP
ncbi:MAG: hypothetical protein ABIU05_10120 [Nitrospirales bacterium]